MNIEEISISSEIIKNKTYYFLLPFLKVYEGFKERFDLVWFYAVGIGDYLYKKDIQSEYLFILLYPNSEQFIEFISWVKHQDYYVVDYRYDSNKLMLVLEFPDVHIEAYRNFLKGKYSKMFSEEEKVVLFDTKYLNPIDSLNHEKILKIINKDVSLASDFEKEIKEEFNVDCSIKGLDIEYSLPPKNKQEIFNYELCSESNRTFINCIYA